MMISSITFLKTILYNIIHNSYCADEFGVYNNTTHMSKNKYFTNKAVARAVLSLESGKGGG